MSETTCPKCRALVRVDAGEPAVCPNCGVPIGADAITASAPGIVASDAGIAEPRPSRFRDEDLDVDLGLGQQKWKLTLTGLHIIWWSSLVMLISSALLQGTMVINPVEPSEMQQPGPIMALTMGLGCVLCTVGVFFLVGFGLCCTAPDRSAKWNAILTIAAVVLWITSTFAFAIALIIVALQDLKERGGPGGPPPDPQVLFEKLGWGHLAILVVQSVFAAGATWFWLRFHAAVAAAFQRPDLRRFAMFVLAIAIVLVPINVVLSQLPASLWGGLEAKPIIRIQNAIGIAVTVIVYGAYLVLCRRLIGVVAKGTPDTAESA